jgi:hypothetical protein
MKLDTTILPDLINEYSRLDLLEMKPENYMRVVYWLKDRNASYCDRNHYYLKQLPATVAKHFPSSWYNPEFTAVTIPNKYLFDPEKISI